MSIFSLPFCGSSRIQHFFCKFPLLLNMACANMTQIKGVCRILIVLFTLCPFLLILLSYIRIISTILKLPSAEGRSKAFSTCSSHLMVVTVSYGTSLITYLVPNSTTKRNLSFLEIVYTSTFLPRLLASLLTRDTPIPVKACIVQLCFFGCLSTVEPVLLSVMSYDRYLAICHPLRYPALMNGRVCGQLVAGSWIISFGFSIIGNSFLWEMPFCGSKEIEHFFCDYAPIIKLSCEDTRTVELLISVVAAIGSLAHLLLTLTFYSCTIAAILRIPSTFGRQKAFSTCSSHLIVLTVFYVCVISVYVVPTANTPKALQKMFSVFYIVLTPLINPVIYCLRNKEVQQSLRKGIGKVVAFRNQLS
ncbi:olfactory receptor 10A2-like [Carettochelys insculpta]|uniref:olfactory receptor 10A2-like n=1 Tax=Carettochelys insculpta TaxID=44489 RepID=UPI003EB716C8